jgi:hypothetical protein
MESFSQLFPDDADPAMTLTLGRKTGDIPKGTYTYYEYYCSDPGCDCRRVTLLVLDQKMKEKAAISLGFDQRGPMDGPYLDPSHGNVTYASALLEFFTNALNSEPQWLDRMYRHYRAVRTHVDGKIYRGKAFPKPGKLVYRTLPSPDLEALIQESLQKLLEQVTAPLDTGEPKGSRPLRKPLAGRRKPASAGPAEEGMAFFVKRFARYGSGGSITHHAALQEELRHYLLTHDQAGDELASLLPALCQQSPEDDEQIEAALRVLFDALDILRLELEGRRPAGKLRMEKLQSALAQRIFIENDDLDLCAAVSHTLLQARVEILPVLREANAKMVMKAGARSDLLDEPGEEMMTGISRSLESMGVKSAFEGVDAMLQLFALNEPEVQTALIGEMCNADSPLLRDISALMLFHPDAQVRLGVAQMLGASEGSNITPDTLRRLIVSRNWFADEMKKQIDQAVTNARKARVDCAPLGKRPSMTVHASTVDGAGAQSFQVIVPDGKGFFSCSLLLKQGVGVADAFVMPFARKRELNDFLAMLKEEGSFIETTPEYLDLRVCQALADGVRTGNAPNYWLVQIAELLGRDRWQAVPFDAHRELAQLRAEMASLFPNLLDEREYLSALEDSADWQASEPILSSWFEDDETVDREIEAAKGRRRSVDPGAAIERIQRVVMENRRAVWLERLVLTTLWLKSSKRAPVPWYRLYHVAKAVADESLPLKEIPLMQAIARLSFEAYEDRRKSGAGSGALR